MGVQRTTFGKLQRDRNKKQKQALKREKRLERNNAEPDDTVEELPDIDSDEVEELTAEQLLVQIEHIHKQFENDEIDIDEFEEKKVDLLARLPID